MVRYWRRRHNQVHEVVQKVLQYVPYCSLLPYHRQQQRGTGRPPRRGRAAEAAGSPRNLPAAALPPRPATRPRPAGHPPEACQSNHALQHQSGHCLLRGPGHGILAQQYRDGAGRQRPGQGGGAEAAGRGKGPDAQACIGGAKKEPLRAGRVVVRAAGGDTGNASARLWVHEEKLRAAKQVLGSIQAFGYCSPHLGTAVAAAGPAALLRRRPARALSTPGSTRRRARQQRCCPLPPRRCLPPRPPLVLLPLQRCCLRRWPGCCPPCSAGRAGQCTGEAPGLRGLRPQPPRAAAAQPALLEPPYQRAVPGPPPAPRRAQQACPAASGRREAFSSRVGARQRGKDTGCAAVPPGGPRKGHLVDTVICSR